MKIKKSRKQINNKMKEAKQPEIKQVVFNFSFFGPANFTQQVAGEDNSLNQKSTTHSEQPLNRNSYKKWGDIKNFAEGLSRTNIYKYYWIQKFQESALKVIPPLIANYLHLHPLQHVICSLKL